MNFVVLHLHLTILLKAFKQSHTAIRMYTLQQISGITAAELRGNGDLQIEHFIHDSRTHMPAEGALFIALRSERNNGHAYIPEMVKRGIKAFMVAADFFCDDFVSEGVSFLKCENPLMALQNLAAWHRKQFDIPVIGITGSNGKTMVKEWLYQLLKDDFSICRNPKSYNSQIGVPLSVLKLRSQHTLGIFEAGISKPGEMDSLSHIIQPTLGVFTSLGSAHDEGFTDRKQKLNEKLKLFSNTQHLVANGINRLQLPGNLVPVTTLVSNTGDADISYIVNDGFLQISSGETKLGIRLPFTDAASAANITTCAALMLQLKYDANTIVERCKALTPVALRLEIKSGLNNSQLINDFYNSDLDSLGIAIDFLQQQKMRKKKAVIISDIEQSGLSPAELYPRIASLLKQQGIDLVIGIGTGISAHGGLFPSSARFYETTSDFIQDIPKLAPLLTDATILLKGARSFGFEQISRHLQLKSHDTVFEIDLNKLTENINYYKSILSPGVKLMCMVKAMGYGSGSAEIARTLELQGVSYLAVAYADEGVELRQSDILLPVMVMSPEENALDEMIVYRLEPEIYSFRILDAFVNALDRSGITEPFPVHIKIDTGMHRLGFEGKDLPLLAARLKQLPQLKVTSVFSHLAASDNPELDVFTAQQLSVFEQAYGMLEKTLGYSFIKHICNSAGITRFKQAHYNMVRLGIGMYGIGATPAEQKQLRNVGTLKTRISQIKEVLAGETVGYNRSGKLDKTSRIATIPIGYADGFSRLLGNGKHGVYINSVFCKTVGSICMDMCMVDVSHVSCQEGDEVIIFSNAEQISAMAKALGTIPYEVLTNVSGRVKRIYTQE